MKKIKNIKRIILHNGVFHTDDVACAAILSLINKNIEVVRTSNIKNLKNTSATIVADIGGGYFDHHNNKNSGERCSIKIIWDTYKTQIINILNISNEVLPQFELFINNINEQDLTGHNSMKGLEEAIRAFNPTVIEKNKETENFKKSVSYMKQIIKMILRGHSLEIINIRLLIIAQTRAKTQKKAMKIAYKFLTMRNKKEATVWTLPCWMPYINLYFEKGLEVPNKIIIKTQRAYSVNSWNYHELEWDERVIPEHVHKSTCIFVKNVHDAHLVNTISNEWY